MPRKKRQPAVPTMAGAPHGPLHNPHWVAGRRVLYLVVPFEQKDAAKELGARWNPDRKSWWIYADLPRGPFAAWLSDGVTTVPEAAKCTKARKPPVISGERLAALEGARRTVLEANPDAKPLPISLQAAMKRAKGKVTIPDDPIPF